MRPLSQRSRQLPLAGEPKAMACGRGGNPSGSQANHLPLTGEAMTVPLDRGAMARSYFLHVSGAKRTSMGKISRRPRNMSKHRTALLIILSPETPMVKVFESMP